MRAKDISTTITDPSTVDTMNATSVLVLATITVMATVGAAIYLALTGKHRGASWLCAAAAIAAALITRNTAGHIDWLLVATFAGTGAAARWTPALTRNSARPRPERRPLAFGGPYLPTHMAAAASAIAMLGLVSYLTQ